MNGLFVGSRSEKEGVKYFGSLSEGFPWSRSDMDMWQLRSCGCVVRRGLDANPSFVEFETMGWNSDSPQCHSTAHAFILASPYTPWNGTKVPSTYWCLSNADHT